MSIKNYFFSDVIESKFFLEKTDKTNKLYRKQQRQETPAQYGNANQNDAIFKIHSLTFIS